MKVAVLFSGGKDSTMAVYNALESGHDVEYLLAMKSANDESYMFHVPNIHLTDLLAEAMDIPIISVETDGIKEEELKDLKGGFEKLKDLGIEAIYTGALYSRISAYGLDEKWLGRKIDEKCIDDLIRLNEKVGINLAFEGGEAETLVLDGPIFKKRVKILKDKKQWYVDSGLYIIEDAILEEK